MTAQHRPPLTDSPWFWVLAFSLMALVALAAMSGKYGRRQSTLERQYQARDRVAAGETGPTAAGGDTGRRPYAMPGQTLVPLWPLASLGHDALVSRVMLWRSRRRLEAITAASS
jgi:hypothetical protein